MNHTFMFRIFSQADSAPSLAVVYGFSYYIYLSIDIHHLFWLSSGRIGLLTCLLQLVLSLTAATASLQVAKPIFCLFPSTVLHALLTFTAIKKQIYWVTCCEFYSTIENIRLFRCHSFLTTGINQGKVNQLWYMWYMCHVLKQSCDCCSLCNPTCCCLLRLMYCFDDCHSHSPLWELKETLYQRKLLEKNIHTVSINFYWS